MKLKHAICLAACGVVLLPSVALALKYWPKPEETLSHVSLIHYGDPKKFLYISVANGISNPDKVPRGKSLWVPTVWRYRIKKGDSLSRIADKYLKDPSRADFLQWLNRIRNPKGIEVGSLLTIPFVLKHRVQQGQTMVDVARRYYFRINKVTQLLRKFNAKRTNALRPGEVILVPIFDKDASIDRVKDRIKRHTERRAKATQEAKDRVKAKAEAKSPAKLPDPQPPSKDAPVQAKTEAIPKTISRLLQPHEPEEDVTTSPAVVTTIQEAFRLYRDGEYERAQANLEGILDHGQLAQSDEAEAREILAFCLVALDRPKEAEHEFVRLLMVTEDRSLDPITTSPKIMEVFNRARGAR